MEPTPSVALLVDNHRAFLRYLERRVGDRALAEDILQDAFVRSLDKVDALPGEAVVRWFYRALRNAVIDHWRRRGSARRALDAFARDVTEQVEPEPGLRNEICACVTRLAASLKPEYAQILHDVEIQDVPVARFAVAHGLSASNARVRVHRARQALRKKIVESCGTCAEHGCLNCTCQSGCD